MCLISLFSLHELFPAFVCAYNTGNLVKSSSGVNTFNPFPSFTSSLSPSGGSMSATFSSPKSGSTNQSSLLKSLINRSSTLYP